MCACLVMGADALTRAVASLGQRERLLIGTRRPIRTFCPNPNTRSRLTLDGGDRRVSPAGHFSLVPAACAARLYDRGDMTDDTPDDDLPAHALDFLESHATLTLATASAGSVPHAGTFLYVNDGPRLYIWTRPS